MSEAITNDIRNITKEEIAEVLRAFGDEWTNLGDCNPFDYTGMWISYDGCDDIVIVATANGDDLGLDDENTQFVETGYIDADDIKDAFNDAPNGIVSFGDIKTGYLTGGIESAIMWLITSWLSYHGGDDATIIHDIKDEKDYYNLLKRYGVNVVVDE